MKSHAKAIIGHLEKLGYKATVDDVLIAHKDRAPEKWRVVATDRNGWIAEITSRHPIADCAKGIKLEQNTIEEELFGDMIAVPK